MTPLAAVVLIGLLATQAVEWVAEVLNLRSLRRDPPPGFEDVYPPDRYARSQDYTRAKTKFGFVSSAVGLGVLVGFWFLGGFGTLDIWCRGWGFGPVTTGTLFLGTLFFLKQLLGIPFAGYATFRLEAKFGFNRTTLKTFLLDRLKGNLLAVVIGGPLVALLLWLFARLGSGAWLWAWGTVAAFSLFLQFIAPTLIMPLFNKFTPLPEGELRAAIFDLAKRLDYPLTNLFVIDGSRRSSKANAFFTGFGKNKRIALFDTLVQKQTVPELTGVLAHEIGHHKKHHVWVGFALGVLQSGGMFFLLSLSLGWEALFAAFRVDLPSVHAGFALFGVLFAPVNLLLTLPLLAYSRRNEFEADRFATEALGTGRDLATGLKKLSADSLANLTPHPFYVWIHHTHPPLVERLAALHKL
ncbi:MAG: M48 family metallopeptidase [Elusimicrobia bacterium]|nr:M48 family metallopeptidase [Elusimicrobiota bacterium]MBK7687577.1 M48 family metallopeptidase [Elusimicrobiota bacterium]MBK8125505.1 M48 family metallopeptidase [Elusimicrobiota bacterium]MBK8651920.1 M48 family metallopeptidase [Elusimicrobiota bacterium]MBK9056918.1 M48 family metallopeptidase [Elusimicrobiota bacterium]